MQVEIGDGLATVAFNRPEVANSLDVSGWYALRDTFRELATNPDVRVILLHGEGKNFCAGMDLSVLGSLAQRVEQSSDDALEQVKRFIVEIQDCVSAITHCSQPVVAAIHGGCIGGGVSIAAACDIRYATTEAQFVVKEVDFGIVADIGTLERLPRIIGHAATLEISLTGRTVKGQEAHALGLVSQTASTKEEVYELARNCARQIAGKDPHVSAGIKAQLLFNDDHDLAEGLDAVAQRSAELLVGRFQA